MTDTVYFQTNDKKRKATEQEVLELEQAQAEAQEAARLLEAEQLAKAEARESAMAKLKKLGLTDDEIAALVP